MTTLDAIRSRGTHTDGTRNVTNVLVVTLDAAAHLVASETTSFVPNGVPSPWSWCSRALAETDESMLQIIPYGVLLSSGGRTAWCYRRTGGDARLEGRCSLGVGGHIEGIDAAPSLIESASRCLARETREELVLGRSDAPAMTPRFWLHERTGPVGRVHLGLVFTGLWSTGADPMVTPGEPIEALGFTNLATVATDTRFEMWSRIAATRLASAAEGDAR